LEERAKSVREEDPAARQVAQQAEPLGEVRGDLASRDPAVGLPCAREDDPDALAARVCGTSCRRLHNAAVTAADDGAAPPRDLAADGTGGLVFRSTFGCAGGPEDANEQRLRRRLIQVDVPHRLRGVPLRLLEELLELAVQDVLLGLLGLDGRSEFLLALDVVRL